jgi:hypothetical protein
MEIGRRKKRKRNPNLVIHTFAEYYNIPLALHLKFSCVPSMPGMGPAVPEDNEFYSCYSCRFSSYEELFSLDGKA